VMPRFTARERKRVVLESVVEDHELLCHGSRHCGVVEVRHYDVEVPAEVTVSV
jgi:hypothetical protein